MKFKSYAAQNQHTDEYLKVCRLRAKEIEAIDHFLDLDIFMMQDVEPRHFADTSQWKNPFF